MSKRFRPTLSILGVLFGAALFTNGNGDVPFQGNRRPGILQAPSDTPTGENALLYRRMGAIPPNELLDLLSEEPKAVSVKEIPLDADDSSSESEASE